MRERLPCQVSRTRSIETLFAEPLSHPDWKGLDNDNLVNNVGGGGGTDANEDNESLNKANSSNPEGGGQTTANNGSSTPLTSAKQKKMFFTKKVRKTAIWYFIENYLRIINIKSFLNIFW